jgi:hypothetical protein
VSNVSAASVYIAISEPLPVTTTGSPIVSTNASTTLPGLGDFTGKCVVEQTRE